MKADVWEGRGCGGDLMACMVCEVTAGACGHQRSSSCCKGADAAARAFMLVRVGVRVRRAWVGGSPGRPLVHERLLRLGCGPWVKAWLAASEATVLQLGL